MKKILNKKLNQIILLTSFTLFFISFDLITKFLLTKSIDSSYEITSFFSLRYTENTGVAFSLPIPFHLIIILNIVLLIILLIYSFKQLNTQKKSTIFLISLVIGGGLGNLIDRIFNGFVIDFISFWSYPLFNFADIFITVGIFSILFFYDKIKR